MTPRHADARVARVVAMFESLAPEDIPRLAEFYAADARFKDPFNDVTGVPAIQRIFTHMFNALDEPRFVVRDIVADSDQCFLTWDFLFRMKRFSRGPQVIHGGSHLRFDAGGKVELHRDYWDAAEELYEKLPGVGALMRWLKRRANS
ncbi:MAG: nuclear transport factor 2 family protein [Piscinibacter sp.]|uniref:nuclear transport factor 2 family protein n=1 Tax=Piscinibacter sp. TaxID=1903157 RepID=UPI003D117589